MSSRFTRHTLETAPEESRRLLEGVEKSYGFLPELFTYMAESPVALKAYLKLNELLEESTLSAAQVQMALLTASTVNDCGFCKVAHQAMAKQAGVDADTIEAIRKGDDVPDDKDRVLVDLVRAIVEKRGWLDEEDLSRFLDAGFTTEQVYELIVAVAMKTLSNYSNHLTEPEPNPELKEML